MQESDCDNTLWNLNQVRREGGVKLPRGGEKMVQSINWRLWWDQKIMESELVRDGAIKKVGGGQRVGYKNWDCGGIVVGCVGEGQDHWKHEIKRSEIGIQKDEC